MSAAAEARAFIAKHELEAHVRQLVQCAPPLPDRAVDVLRSAPRLPTSVEEAAAS